MGQDNTQIREDISTSSDAKVAEPPMYKVLIHNDDYTTMEFVVEVLVYIFRKTTEEATNIMFQVHTGGIGICGIYPYEIAETKVDTVKHLAEDNGFPLMCTMEKE